MKTAHSTDVRTETEFQSWEQGDFFPFRAKQKQKGAPFFLRHSMNHICSILVALMTAVCMADFTFQTDDTTMTISSSSSNVTIFDRSTAHDFLASSRGLVFATGSSTQAFSTSAAASATPGEPGEVVIDAFVATLSVTVTVAIRAEPTHFVFRVLGCTAGASAQVPMLSTSCKTSGSYLSCASVDADFGVVVRELDRQHRPFASGSAGSVSVLWMTESFGSKVLMVASPMATIRQRLRDALIFENATLISGHGGPSAWNSSRSRESYVFADVSESNCNSWINFARGWGFGTLLFSHRESLSLFFFFFAHTHPASLTHTRTFPTFQRTTRREHTVQI